MKAPVSVLILTLNEEKDLPGCLDSLSWVDEIVVLDSGSSDATTAIAKSYGCRCVMRKFDNWSAHQNWALANIAFRNTWVLNVDADERPTPELADEIARAVAQPGSAVAFQFRRKDFFRKTWLKHATFYPTWLTRLYRPECVRFERLVNPVSTVRGQTGTLTGHLNHYPFSKGVAHWVNRHNAYSTFEASEYTKPASLHLSKLFTRDRAARRQAAKRLFSRLPFRPLVKFLYLYAFHQGFLDGRAGLDYCLLQSFYEYLIALKARELSRAGDPTTFA